MVLCEFQIDKRLHEKERKCFINIYYWVIEIKQ